VATVCPERQERSMTVKRDYVKDVNLCTVLDPLGTFQQFGKSFQFCLQVSASKRNNGKFSVVCVLECESESRIK